MKRVTGCIDVRALGCYNFDFYVEDNLTEEEIKKKVEDVCEYYIDYEIEDGYEAVQKIVYQKKER